MSDIDLDVADSFGRIYPVPSESADWADVLHRARVGWHRRRIVLIAAALLVVVVTSTSAFGLLFGERRIAAAGSASWSPDGRRIAFLTVGCNHGCGGSAELHVMNADGTGQRKLSGDWESETVFMPPVWSPDWRRMAFVRGRGAAKYGNGGRDSDIYLANADGGGSRRLTQSPQRDGDPVWSPDGRRLAFVRVGYGVGDRALGFGDIYLVNVDGSGLRRLVRAISPLVRMPGGPTWGFSANPAWSPDGRRIAFVSNRDGSDDIFVVNVDGTGLRNMTRSRGNDHDPVWSPDGRVIAFTGHRARPSELERAVCRGHCDREEIYAVNADGSGLRRLTRNWKADRGAVWSPDGRKILYERRSQVFVMNADGSGQRNLTRSVTRPFASDEGAAWSPDGRKILFVSNRGDGNWFEVYVMNADGSNKRQLTQLKGRD
jgi:Tol biopolymer transport system component